MGLFGDKKKLLIDLDRGIVGTFVDTEDDPTGEDYTYIRYVPLNSMRIVRYAESVPRSAIFPVISGYKAAGVEPEIVYIAEGKTGALKFINNELMKRVEELRSQNTALKVQVATHKKEAEDYYSDAKKAISRVEGIKRKTEEDNDILKNRFGEF